MTTISLYTSPGCGLCERALEVVREAEAELGFELEVVDIDGDPILESEYRELVPVVDIDDERAFTYFVEPNALRDRVAAAGP